MRVKARSASSSLKGANLEDGLTCILFHRVKATKTVYVSILEKQEVIVKISVGKSFTASYQKSSEPGRE